MEDSEANQLQAFKIELKISSLNKVKMPNHGELIISVKDGNLFLFDSIFTEDN